MLSQNPDLAVRKIVAVIPAYNEERFIASVVFLAKKHAHTVIVVDDGSSDRTPDLAAQAGALVVSIPHAGKAAAMTAGFRQALTVIPDVVVTLDGDAQHDPAEIPAVAAPVIQGVADVVIGSRFMEKHSVIPAWRQVGQHALTAATNLASGVRLTDSQSGYRAFSPLALETLRLTSPGLSVESEMQLQLSRSALRVLEVGVGVQYLDPPKRNPVTHGVQILDTLITIVARRHPLLVFGFPGVAFAAIGLLAGLEVLRVMSTDHVLMIGTALFGAVMGIGGLFLGLTGVILNTVESVVVRVKKDIAEAMTQPRREPSLTTPERMVARDGERRL